MTWLELVGRACIYAACLLGTGYGYIAVAAFMCRKRGLEAIPFIIFPAIVIFIAGAVGGLFWLGTIIGSMQ